MECTDGPGRMVTRTASETARDWQGSRTVLVMCVLGLEHALAQMDHEHMLSVTLIGLQDDMTCIGSARLNLCWTNLEETLKAGGHRLRSYRCGVWVPGNEQPEDHLLPNVLRVLGTRIP